MKANLEEYGEDVLCISITPEDKEEVLKLLRYSENARKVPPNYFFSFKTGNLQIYLKKIYKSVQKTSKSYYK